MKKDISEKKEIHKEREEEDIFSIWQTLDPILSAPNNFWKLDRNDLFCFLFIY